MTEIKTPRNFILLDAINKACNFAYVTYGLIDEDDKLYKNNFIKLEHWMGTLMYDDGFNLNILNITFKCTLNFPEERPIVKFCSESLEIPAVKKICDNDGNILPAHISKLKWSSDMQLGEYLVNIIKIL